MNYLAYLTLLDTCAESPQHSRHIYEFHDLVKLMIEQLVPPIVDQQIEQYFTTHKDDIMKNTIQDMVKKQTEKQVVDVQAYFNGRPATNANIIKGVREMLQKAFKKIR